MSDTRTRPLVSIVCETYNHEKYVKDCLDGFLMQKVNFEYEILIHDDASTDGTQAIIREYESRYPDKIKPIYQTENQYSKGVKIWSDIQFPRARGKYIALCEGDDYWTDPLKLQKQVDFLESHPDYSMCFGNAIEHWEANNAKDKCFSYVENRDYDRIEILKNWIIPTASVLYRSTVNLDSGMIAVQFTGKILAGDILLFLTCFKYGKIRGFSDTLSVYRRHECGIVLSVMDKDLYKFMIHEITLGCHFKGDILKYSKKRAGDRFVCELKRFKDKHKLNLRYMMRAFYFAPLSCIRTFFKFI